MSDIEWTESFSYDTADKINEALSKAYAQGVCDAWTNVRRLRDMGELSMEWSTDEMMRYADGRRKCAEDVKKIADEIGINALYAIVKEMRGEG